MCILWGHPILLNEESLSVGTTGNAWGPVTASCGWGQVRRNRSPGMAVVVHGEVGCARAREVTLRTGKEHPVTGLGQTAALPSAGHDLEQMTSSAPLCAP